MTKTLQTTALLLAAMAAGYVGGLMSQAGKPAAAQVFAGQAVQDVVIAREFQLLDKNDKVRVNILMDGNHPRFRMINEHDFILANIGSTDTGTQLALFKANAENFTDFPIPQVALWVENTGDSSVSIMGDKSRFELWDSDFNRRLVLGYIETVDTKTKEKVTTYPLSTITLFDKDSKVSWQESP